MKTEIRLTSVGNGPGGPEAAMIDLIYMHLLNEFDQDIYNRIGINQVGYDLEEFIDKEPGNKIHINIRLPFYADYNLKDSTEKNLISLDIVHTALLRIAEYDGKLDIKKIEAIRKKILDNKFLFEIVYKVHINRKNPDIVAKVIIQPLIDRFIYSVLINEKDLEKCRQIIFIGIPGYYYADKFFLYGKWKGDSKFIISGKEKEVEFHVTIDECWVESINLTKYLNPPYLTLMKFGISKAQEEIAYRDWNHSLNPAIAAIIRGADN